MKSTEISAERVSVYEAFVGRNYLAFGRNCVFRQNSPFRFFRYFDRNIFFFSVSTQNVDISCPPPIVADVAYAGVAYADSPLNPIPYRPYSTETQSPPPPPTYSPALAARRHPRGRRRRPGTSREARPGSSPSGMNCIKIGLPENRFSGTIFERI